MGANGEKVLAHCGMGLNRSALVAGLVPDLSRDEGEDAVALLREKTARRVINENFAAYLAAVPPDTTPPGPS